MNIWGSPAERYETEKPKRKLLALNGGAIRGVKTLEIISSLEERLKKNSANASAKRDKIRRDIFICYRREDSAEVVDRIYGELQAAYPGRVFRDISEMQGGLDFEDQVKHQLQQCQAALVVIGPDWLNCILALQAPNGGFRTGPGLEPQVWCTAQCLTALLTSPLDLKEEHDKIVRAFQFIENSRDAKTDGWGLFEDSSVAQTELAAWVCVANAQLLASTRSKLFADQVPDARRRINRDLASIARCQLPSPRGAWSPIWVPDKMVPELARTYSTIMALWVLAEARDVSDIHEEIGSKYDVAIDEGVAWLLANFHPDVGLPAAPSISHDPFPGLTAQAIYVLRRIERVRPNLRNLGADPIAKEIFLKLVNTGEPFQSRDVMGGEVSNLRPTQYKLENSSFLRFPWFLLATSSLRNDDALSGADKKTAAECFERLKFRSGGLDTHLRTAETWEIAETLFCVSSTYLQLKA